MLTVFWMSLFGAAYSYLIYPMLLLLLPRRPFAIPADSVALPTVSFIITAHNEEASIENKLQNTLAIDYPQEKLEVIVASDASTDATNSIVGAFADKNVVLVSPEERRGKEYAQLCAIEVAKGDILVFSDVATRVESKSLGIIAQEFSDEKIGALSSTDHFDRDDGNIVGEGLYVQYEMWLRRLESQVAGLVGLSGSFFAARREVCGDWDILAPSDFNTALNCVKAGYFAVSSQELIGSYKDVKSSDLEYRRKVRTVIRGITGVVRNPGVLNPFKYGLFSFQVWSHKIMRWGTPWFLAGLLLSNAVLASTNTFFTVMFVIQIAFYGLALLSWIIPVLRRNMLSRIIFFFVQSNVAVAHATFRFVFGHRVTTWVPSER